VGVLLIPARVLVRGPCALGGAGGPGGGLGSWVPTMALGPALVLRSHKPRVALVASTPQWSPSVALLTRGAHRHLQLL